MKRHIHLCRGRQSGAKDQVGSQSICIGPDIKDSDHILGHEDRSCKHFRLFISSPVRTPARGGHSLDRISTTNLAFCLYKCKRVLQGEGGESYEHRPLRVVRGRWKNCKGGYSVKCNLVITHNLLVNYNVLITRKIRKYHHTKITGHNAMYF